MAKTKGGIITDEKTSEIGELQIYNWLEDSYMGFLKFCYENPEMDIFDIADEKFASVKEKKEMIAFAMVLSLHERAFLTLRLHPDLKDQWDHCWEPYIKRFVTRKGFKEKFARLYNNNEMEFDARFEDYMADIMHIPKRSKK